jgi:hypothetical protein
MTLAFASIAALVMLVLAVVVASRRRCAPSPEPHRHMQTTAAPPSAPQFNVAARRHQG